MWQQIYLTQREKKWIVLVYRYSGYAWTDKLRDTSTATVTAKLNSWFVEYGYPECIRTDVGPQFRRDFKAYCDKHDITHELSSPYNPESNGLAEAAVKNIVTFADSYLRANIEFRNKACTRGKYYSYTKLYFVLFVFIYVYSHMYVRHVLAVALASLP